MTARAGFPQRPTTSHLLSSSILESTAVVVVAAVALVEAGDDAA